MNTLTAVLTDKADRDKISSIIQDLTNKVFDVKFATSLPGGFTSCSFNVLLSQSRAYEWYERFLFFGLNIYENDNPVWEGRISNIEIKDFGVSVICEGYWSSLADQVMYSWWTDNDMSKWIIPQPGAGGISDEISLSGAGKINKFNISNSGAQLWISTKKNQVYSIGDKAIMYYRLPRISNLANNSPFQPNTIHAIRYFFDLSQPSASDLRPRVWTADYPKGTWTQGHDPQAAGNIRGLYAVNLVADGTIAEAVAIGVDIVADFTESDEDDDEAAVFRDITIYAERDAFIDRTRRTTFKNIAVDLLAGQSPDTTGVTAHAKQVSTDFLLVEESELEYVPLIFSGETLQDIFTKMLSFGMGDVLNMLPNPNVEDNINGWFNEDASQVSPDADAFLGSQAVQVTHDAANEGISLLNDLRTGPVDTIDLENDKRFSIKPSTEYTFSIHLKAVSGSNGSKVQLLFYNAAGTIVQTKETSASITGSYVRYNANDVGPSTAVAAQCRVVANDATLGVYLADAAQLEEGPLSDYIDPDQRSDVFWAGAPGASVTMRVRPATLGVFGRNRLVAKRRDETNVKWLLSISEIDEGGIELQKSIENYFSKIWGKFEKFISGDTGFTEGIENFISQQIIYDQRDTVLELGKVLEGFAQLAARAHLDDVSTPRHSSQITITGTIRNMLGAREPLWRVRAGDLLLINDLAPLGTIRRLGADSKILDKLRVFLIKDTEYDASTGELTIVPDSPMQTLDLLLSRLETTQSPSGVSQTSVAFMNGRLVS